VQQKKLFEDRERQLVVLAGQQTKQSQLESILVTPAQFPMLPLGRPVLYLPFIERQTRTKHNQNNCNF
jgi:hypothetical protein